ncbi:hypothetical protein Hc94105_0116 [Helicobacter cinaedi]|uniref:hypothetical protein n=1 Tax=Helicobacter cinaedi TaxID=213 RepID=UPI001F247422|nr:hypothetical protein [Helicobacter cinaedi]BDB65937.1 hypothetical protein Hc94105_0116 [Helicobacter cinaedi]
MDSNMLLMSLQDKLPNDQMKLHALKERLDKMDEQGRQDFLLKTNTLGLCNPKMVFWVGGFLLGFFGVAWLMLKNMPLFIAKLSVWALWILLLIIAAATDSAVVAGFSLVPQIIVYVWFVVDLFIVGKRAREFNYQKIMQSLM